VTGAVEHRQIWVGADDRGADGPGHFNSAADPALTPSGTEWRGFDRRGLGGGLARPLNPCVCPSLPRSSTSSNRVRVSSDRGLAYAASTCSSPTEAIRGAD
jgi:hypothetical protein